MVAKLFLPGAESAHNVPVQDLPELLGGPAPLVPVEDAVAALNSNHK